MDDLRDVLEKLHSMGEVKTIKGLHWDLEIGAALDPKVLGKDRHAVLFDEIVGYPAGRRVLTGAMKTPRSLSLCLNLPQTDSTLELTQMVRERLPEWQAGLEKFGPRTVETGPVLENVDSGRNVDLFRFPAPRWHELDGGRYIGTGCAVITRDPDKEEINLGTYRIMIQDEKTVALYISPGHHGRIHYEKYHARGEACPVAISVGQHPLIFLVSATAMPFGAEYNYIGAISGEPTPVIEEERTGLPIPAASEIVIVGRCPPGKVREEGPFGEWTGYYASGERPAPIVEVERIYYRNDPIILGAAPTHPLSGDIFRGVFQGAILLNDLENAGVPDVKGVWISDFAGQQCIVVSIKQRYGGHARQAAFAASQGSVVGAYHGRYVVVVDDDIDPTDIRDVMWAVCTRSDPEKDIDLIRRAWSTPLDTMIRKPTDALMNSRAIIDACRPYEWLDRFPTVIDTSPELLDKIRQKLQMER